MEGLIFSNHFYGRGEVDVQLHIMHALTIFMIAFFCTLEAFNEHQVLFTYGRVLFTFLQGTWFLQIAITLYHPVLGWDLAHHDHELVPNVTFVYSLHFFAILVGLLVELAIVRAIMGITHTSGISLSTFFRSRQQVFVFSKVNYEKLLDEEDDKIVYNKGDN
jgi:hypothetical protein